MFCLLRRASRALADVFHLTGSNAMNINNYLNHIVNKAGASARLAGGITGHSVATVTTVGGAAVALTGAAISAVGVATYGAGCRVMGLSQEAERRYAAQCQKAVEDLRAPMAEREEESPADESADFAPAM